MRWHQAKTVMLLIFLGLNLLFAYLNFWQPLQIMSARSDDRAVLEHSLTLLAERNISILELPDPTPQRMAPLHLQRAGAAVIAQTIPDLFFSKDTQGSRLQTLSGGEIWRYNDEEQTLEIAPDGRWTYRPAMLPLVGDDAHIVSQPESNDESNFYTEQEARWEALDFLKAKNIDFSELTPSPFTTALGTIFYETSSSNIHAATPLRSDAYLFTWQQLHAGKPIFDATLSVRVLSGRIGEVSSSLAASLHEQSSHAWVSSVNDMLLRLLRDSYLLDLADAAQKQEETLMIRNLTLGYFTRFATGDTEAEIIAHPVWRVLLAEGTPIYYDAYNTRRIYP